MVKEAMEAMKSDTSVPVTLEKMADVMALFVRLNRTITQKYGCLDKNPIPPAQINTLVCLRQHGVLSMTQLSQQLVMQRQQVTQVTQALFKKGLIARKADPYNRRLVLIELTEDGEHTLHHILEEHYQVFQQLLGLMREEDQERFIDAIEQILDIISNIRQPA